MKTVVETFIIEETAPLIYENEQLDKWNGYVAALGLEGQTKIVKKDKSPIPFMHLKTSHEVMFKTLCPKEVDIKEYDITPIPVEILDLVALSVKEEYFDRIQIWYDDKKPDPVCVGIISDFYIYSYQGVPRELVGKTVKNRDVAMAMVKAIVPDFEVGSSIGWSTNHKTYLIGKWGDVKHSFETLKQMAMKRFKNELSIDLKNNLKKVQTAIADIDETVEQKFE